MFRLVTIAERKLALPVLEGKHKSARVDDITTG
jgi:hypothetical protein